jgi:hypothetical protein
VSGEKRDPGDKIIALRMLAFDLFAEDGGFRLGALHGCARTEAADDGESVAPTVGFFAERKRKVKINAAAGSEDGGEVKRSGENADDRDRGVVDSQRAADDGRVGGEAALPKTVTEKDGLGTVPFAFLSVEEPAKLRLHAEKREKIFRNGNAGEALRFTLAGEFAVSHAVESKIGGHVGERLIVDAQIEEVVYLDGCDGEAALPIVPMIGNPHEAGGVAERQGADEKGVDDAEDGAAGADAETDDENGEGSEAEVAAEGAEGVLEVARKGVQPADGAEKAGWLHWLRKIGHESLPGGSRIRDDGEAEKVTREFRLTWWDEDKKFLLEEKSEREPGESSGEKRKTWEKGRPSAGDALGDKSIN